MSSRLVYLEILINWAICGEAALVVETHRWLELAVDSWARDQRLGAVQARMVLLLIWQQLCVDTQRGLLSTAWSGVPDPSQGRGSVLSWNRETVLQALLMSSSSGHLISWVLFSEGQMCLT